MLSNTPRSVDPFYVGAAEPKIKWDEALHRLQFGSDFKLLRGWLALKKAYLIFNPGFETVGWRKNDAYNQSSDSPVTRHLGVDGRQLCSVKCDDVDGYQSGFSQPMRLSSRHRRLLLASNLITPELVIETARRAQLAIQATPALTSYEANQGILRFRQDAHAIRYADILNRHRARLCQSTLPSTACEYTTREDSIHIHGREGPKGLSAKVYQPEAINAPTLLLFPGAGLPKEIFGAAQTYWAKQGIPSVALDPSGQNQSSGKATISDDAHARDMIAVAGKFVSQQYGPPVIVGHSISGYFAQVALQKDPRAFQAGVLIASLPPDKLLSHMLNKLWEHPVLFSRCLLRIRASLRPIISSHLLRELLFSDLMSDEEFEATKAKMTSGPVRAYQLMALRSKAHPERIYAPMHVIGADNDRMISPNEVQRTAEAYRTEPLFVPSAAHDLIQTHPEMIAESVTKFVRERCSRATFVPKGLLL